MKSISFQRNKSLIRVVNEKQGKQKNNWDRIIYLALLCLFVLLLTYYVFVKLFFIHANGHVIIESTKVRLTDDARIIDFYVSEGDSVRLNDTLFSYALDLDQDQASRSTFNSDIISEAQGETRDLWHLKESYNLKKSIELNYTRIKENKELINSYNEEIKRLTNEVILDVLPKTRLDVVQNEIIKLKNENKQLIDENNTYARLMNSITPLPANSTRKSKRRSKRKGGNNVEQPKSIPINKLFFTDELLSHEKFFRAPMSGIVTRIYIKPSETALKTEEILNIHRGFPAFIKAFFEQKDLRYFSIGDKFTLEFPDGSKSIGVLKRFYIATYQMPDEFQAKYEPTTRTIAGDIYPEKESDREKWLIFNKMSVEISKYKY
ncbi:MAG TPA: hypothetical protein PLU73_00650 [Bacteroidia bacterium]|nr:hypothetical protein [Bacteroidia bacterium]